MQPEVPEGLEKVAMQVLHNSACVQVAHSLLQAIQDDALLRGCVP